MSTVLLTGASGEMGLPVARALADLSVPTRALVRDAARTDRLAGTPSTTVVGDFTEPASLREPLRDIEVAILITGDDPDQVRSQLGFIDAARRAGVRHVIKLSAHSAGLEPPVSWGVAHREVEDRLIASGMAYTFVRPYVYMQNFLRYALRMARRGRVIAPMSAAPIAFVDARDVATLIAHIARDVTRHAGATYPVSGPEALTFAQATRSISAVTGRRVRVATPPALLARFLLPRLTGIAPHHIPPVLALFRALRHGAQSNVSDAFTRVVGAIPRTFDEFVREYVGAFDGSRPPETGDPAGS